MGHSGYVHVAFRTIKRTTAKAILVVLEDGREIWFPVSQVADAEDYEENEGPGTISVTEWIARQKDLEID